MFILKIEHGIIEKNIKQQIKEERMKEKNGEDIYKQYYSQINRNKAIKLLSLDDKSKLEKDKIIHVGAGAKILFQIEKFKPIKEGDYPKAELYLSLLNRFNPSYNRTSIRSLTDLYKVVEPYMGKISGNSKYMELSFDDIKNIHSNSKEWKDMFDKKYNIVINKDQRYYGEWNGKTIGVYPLLVGKTKLTEYGFAVVYNGQVKHIISIYEPHGCEIMGERGLIVFWGHESIIHLWLDNNEINTIPTR